jgi:GntR family transcriptional regulator/MocR family aminotransferase
MRRAAGSLFTTIALDPFTAVPLYRQLCYALRSTILSGQLQAGARLPSTRVLAGELGVARSTVVTAFEQLIAEGYLKGRSRGGTYVAPTLPDDLLDGTARSLPTPVPEGRRQVLSRRSRVA